VVDDMVMLVTDVNNSVMVVFVFVVSDVVMLVIGVNDGAMVVFIFATQAIKHLPHEKLYVVE
jgi:hypothetical protein